MLNDALHYPRNLFLLGTPGSRRVRTFAEAAGHYGWEVQVVPYLDLLSGRLAEPPWGAIVRIESPSECMETTRAILRAGIEPVEASGRSPLGQVAIDDATIERGEIVHPRQWYLGFRSILRRLGENWGDRVQWMSTPQSIATAFDKLACLELWTAGGLPVPRRYSDIASYDELRQRVDRPHARVFVKLRYGYSAIGAVAIEWRGALVRALTTVEVASAPSGPRFFLTKRTRALQQEAEIAWLIDALAKEEIIVEEWLPKARWHGRPYDLRVVTIGGHPRHAVGRANSSPFTNLNLDAQRIAREDLMGEIGAAWENVESLCGRAATLIEGAGTLGIDVLVRPCRRRFVLLEANAFGDYLPNLRYEGLSIYEMQLRQLGALQTVSA